ncbi:MAG TPA: M36 family metallopeptidase [Kofleriaceae bacterium]|nr:M36 family metallopeptidase [Kofleriaceae bacterium]
MLLRSRIRTLAWPGVALAITAACSSPSSTPTPNPSPDPTGDPPGMQPPADVDRAAVALGMTIDARDASGAPRLIRAIVPRRGIAGMAPDQAARDHVAALAPLWMQQGQRPADLTPVATQPLRNGAAIVRMQQRIDGIDVHQGELHVMVNADSSLAAVSGTLRASAGRTTFRSNAATAADLALDALYGASRVHPPITLAAARAGYQELSVAEVPDFHVAAARAKRELLFRDGDMMPIWSVEVIADRTGFDDKLEFSAKRFLISDANGSVVRTVDLVANDAFVYRAFAETTGNRTPLDGALANFTPHPTGVPDGSLPGPGPYNLVVMEAFNGPHDPWLATNATTTTGNNVDAFADIAPPAGFGAGDIRPEVKSGRVLNYVYDLNAGPLDSVTQSKAAAVNVFFVTNWLHDWYYDSGFTEAVGNAQTDNFGRGGVGGDPLIARAQSAALSGSRDNANMATPDDGLSPIMNMFLWSGALVMNLTTPTATPQTAQFVLGPAAFDLTGTAVLATNTTGGAHTACTPINSVAGKIAVFEFTGACGSGTSVNNAKAAGAIGVIAVIADPTLGLGTLNGSATANLPGLVVASADGLALEAQLPAVVSLQRKTTTEHDGDLDNAIVSHEWGHYLHHRLASCEVFQCGAMSEGWGDFNALMMMSRDGDNRDGTFGAGLYALTAGGIQQSGFISDPGFFGIRRFAYSTNRAKNALSFRHISDENPLPDTTPINPGPVGNGNFEVHNAGEVWATMMFEAYNVILDAHPFAEAHRRMSDYVVAGLLLTPPDATYTEGRDAILAAAGALDTDDMILMAAAFAGRGAGTCAISPPGQSFFLDGVVESGTIAARIATSPVSVSDDSASCDHDGYLDPGESGTLRITLANSGVIGAENTTVTATTTTPGITLGKPVVIGTVAPLSQVDVAIPIKMALTAPTNADLAINVKVDSDAGCGTAHIAIPFHQRMGVDEAAAVATTDGLETKLFAWTPAGSGGASIWGRATEVTGNHTLFGFDAPFISDTQAVSPMFSVGPAPFMVRFQNAFDMEADSFGDFFDGGVIELSTDSGMTWADVTTFGANPGYTGTLALGGGNPIEGRSAYVGRSAGFPSRQTVTLDFGTQFTGKLVQLRFRAGSDSCCSTASGWSVDDIAVSGITNTPFPGYVAEPTRCTSPTPAKVVGGDGVMAVHLMPRHSLTGVPGASDPQ